MASLTIPAMHAADTTRTPATLPWPLWTLTLALILVTAGGQADVSWHRTIGRDSFWTPPHMMVYACGLIAGLTCAWIILSCTFNPHSPHRPHSVSLLGLRAPLGIFVTAWGGLLMLYSAPVDNWWHNAYGLDVRVVSPPHLLLLAGTWAVALGTLLLAASHLNRVRLLLPAAPASTTSAQDIIPHQRLFLFLGALAVIHLMSYSMGYTFDTRLHQAKPYLVLSTAVPFTLAALAAAARRRWTATLTAALYTGFMLVTIWILQFIPATPHLGPVYQPITHLIPPKFPILLLAPAPALDLLWQHPPARRPNPTSLLSGFVWITLLVAAEWPFATFLMTPHAANRFFATGPGFLDFGTPPSNPDALRLFEQPQHGLHLLTGLLLAGLLASLAVHVGTHAGRLLRQVLR